MTRICNKKRCRIKTCAVELDETTTHKSYLKWGINLCRNCENEQRHEEIIKLRIKVIEKLENECKLCGEKRYGVLSIDHKNGGGQADRKNQKSWKKYLKSILKLSQEEVDEKYRCLCYNCNYTLGFYGVTPNQLLNIIPDQSILPVSDRGVSNTHLSKEEHQKRYQELENIAKLRHKLEILKAYGNECVKCNSVHPLLLTIDHINNNGNQEISKKGQAFYTYLKGLGYPGKGTQLQILCHNCNAEKEYIDRRVNKSEIISETKEIYIKQEYKLTPEEDYEILNKTRDLYSQLKIYKDLHGIKITRSKKTKT